MPTYRYRCNECKDEFEVRQKILDDRLKDCAKCRAPALERLITNTNSTVFKGKGWFNKGGY